MSDPAPTRRSFLSYATGGGVAVGALVALGALGRSCAPRSSRVTRFDLSDMADGEMRLYTIGGERTFITRSQERIVVLSGACPVDPPFGWIMPRRSAEDSALFCPRCTSRFNRTGQITQFWSNPTPPDTAPNLNTLAFETDGLALLLAENQSAPVLEETGL